MKKIRVRVVPSAKTTEIAGKSDGVWRIRLAAPPHDGKANTELIRFLADALDVPKSSVVILNGHASKLKTVGIPDGFSLDDVATSS